MAALPRKVLAFSMMAVNFGVFGMEIVDKRYVHILCVVLLVK